MNLKFATVSVLSSLNVIDRKSTIEAASTT